MNAVRKSFLCLLVLFLCVLCPVRSFGDELKEMNREEETSSEAASETKAEESSKKMSEELPKLTAVTGLKLNNKEYRTIKVTWKKVKGADGYVISYSSDKGMKKCKTKTVKGGSSTSGKLTKLSIRTQCYVKVSAYRLKGSKKVLGPAGKKVHKKVTGKLIAIDPGHQKNANYGTEPIGPGSSRRKMKVTDGTSGVVTKKAESVLNLEVSKRLKTELENAGYEVRMIRTKQNVNLSNVKRAKMANEWKADAFIRIHANSSGSSSANGVGTYCPTKNNPFPVRKLYKKCYKLSKCILNNVCKTTKARKDGLFESDEYTGINWSKVPVTILEMGYMSNPKEDRLLSTKSYQKKIVKGIVKGFDQYFGR